MKKIVMTVFGIMLLAGCQNELYNNSQDDFSSDQGVYIINDAPIQMSVEAEKEYIIKDIKVGLAVKENKECTISLSTDDQTEVDKYNKKNGTSYVLLPSDMYEFPTKITFAPNVTSQFVPISIKNTLKFSAKGGYALPIRISEGDVSLIPNENTALVLLDEHVRIRTKVLQMNGIYAGASGTENASMFPADFKVNQWTLEAMIKRTEYKANNRSIGGTKTVKGADPKDEIYPRFGDVTIKHDQLQIKTGATQIDVPREKFAAKANEWYMLSFVYDGKVNSVYVNGELVAEQEIRTGAYSLCGFWLGGANEHIREVRFWDIARTPQQLKTYAWTMVDPTEKGLLLYYPCNGKKRDYETGEITEDETKIWNWATYYSGDKDNLHLQMKGNYEWDDNNGDMFIFPLED